MDSTGHRAARPTGYGWLISRATAMPLSPALFNSGLVGVLALAGALAWYEAAYCSRLAWSRFW